MPAHDRFERDELPGCRLERKLRQRLRFRLIAWVELEQNAILGAITVDRRRPPWAKAAVEGRRDPRGIEIQRGNLVAVEVQADSGIVDLDVRGNILQLGPRRHQT